MSIIEDNNTLKSICKELSKSQFIAIDTEFMRDNTFWPKLCLIQMATSNTTAIIDPLADGIDLSPIDLIMKDNKTLVFIEVRYRSYDHFGSAAESITKKKQNRIIQTAQHFIMSHQVTEAIRFDVVAVAPDTSKKMTCNWIKNVFQDCL